MIDHFASGSFEGLESPSMAVTDEEYEAITQLLDDDVLAKLNVGESDFIMDLADNERGFYLTQNQREWLRHIIDKYL